MKSFYECNFKSRRYGAHQLVQRQQVYLASDLEDAMRQHERVNTMMTATYPEYECDLITMSEVESKSKVKRLKVQWQK